MKIKIDFRRILVVVGGFIGIIVLPIAYNSSYNYPNTGIFNIDHPLKPIDPEVSEDLPHRQYKRLSDSLKRDRDTKNGRLNYTAVGSLGLGWLEFEHINHETYSNGEREYVLLLGWWKLKKENEFAHVPIYFVEKGQSYLRSSICGPNTSKNPEQEVRDCKEIDRKVPFRYDLRENRIAIPISENAHQVMQWVSYIYIAGILILVLYFVLLVFMNFLRDIAYGDPFSEKNVRRLRTIAINILILPVLELLINLLGRLVYAGYFTSDIILNTGIWRQFTKPVVLSVIFVALYFAFKKGKKLQDEIDLTV